MNQEIHIIIGRLAILLRNRMGSQKGRDHIQGSISTNAMDDPEHFQLRFRFQAVSALNLKGSGAKPLAGKGVSQGCGKELILGGGPHGPHRGENPPSPLEDFEVVHTLHPKGKLLLPPPCKAHVGMGVHETGNQGEALAVNLGVHVTGRKSRQHLLFFSNGFHQPIPAIEGSALEMPHLPLAFSSQRTSRVGRRCDGGISEELSHHVSPSPSICSRRSSITCLGSKSAICM
jgi:hypothetical protein